MVRVLLVTTLVRNLRSKESLWSSREDVASAASHNIGARYATERKFLTMPSFGCIASAACHDIGARYAIDFFNRISCPYRDQPHSHHLLGLLKKEFNRKSCTNTVTSYIGIHNTSNNAKLGENMQSHISRQYPDEQHLHISIC